MRGGARARSARAALKRQLSGVQPKGGFTIALPAEVTTIQPAEFERPSQRRRG